MKRNITYHITEQPLTMGRPATANEFLRSKGYSRHLMTYLRHHDRTLLVNGEPVFTNRPLQEGDMLTAIFEDEEGGTSYQAGSEAQIPSGSGEAVSARIIPNHMDLDIVFEDEDILVVNKPPYLPVQPSLGHREWTLGNGVAAYYAEQGLPFVYRCVNRIDKNTSGLVLIAKNMASSAILYDAMKKRQINRVYYAVVHGKLDDTAQCCVTSGGLTHACTTPDRTANSDRTASGVIQPSGRGYESRVSIWPEYPGVIDLPIARLPGSTIMREVNFEKGKRAVTHFRTLSYDEKKDVTALLVKLETGRTHQIRVHMSYIGHPIAGDGMYGMERDYISRQALHSASLDFRHPITQEPLHFECPVPDDIRSITEASINLNLYSLRSDV